MSGCDATLQLMLNWSLANRLIVDFHVRDTDVVVMLSDGRTELDFEDARTFMESVVLRFARSADSTMPRPFRGASGAWDTQSG